MRASSYREIEYPLNHITTVGGLVNADSSYVNGQIKLCHFGPLKIRLNLRHIKFYFIFPRRYSRSIAINWSEGYSYVITISGSTEIIQNGLKFILFCFRKFS